MKKICFFTDSIHTLGGIQRVVTSLCNKLLNDYEITVICQYKVNSNKRVNYNLNEKIMVKIIDNNLYGIDKIIFAPIRLLRYIIFKYNIKNKISNKIMNFDYKIFKRYRLIRFLNKQNFDYVISEGLNNNIYLSKIKNKIKSPIIGCWHSSFESYIPNYDERNIVRSLRILDKTVVLTRHDVSMIKEKYDIDVNYIYNFIISKKVNSSKLNNKIFLAVGRYSEEKGYERLIKLFYDFNTINKDWKLFIVGEGPERSRLQSLIDEYQLSEKVILTGKTNEIEKYYLQSSMLLLTSYVEGFPMVALEAMKYGLPIVAYDIPVLHEMLPNDDFIIPQDDSKRFVNAMNKLTEDEKLRKQIGIINSKKCEDFYDDKIIKQWKEILK